CLEAGSYRRWPEIDASRLRTSNLSVLRDSAPPFGSRLGVWFLAPWFLAPGFLPALQLVSRGHLITRSGGDALGVAEDEVEVPGVDEEACRLTENEHRVAPPEGVGEQDHAAA